jgi:flagellar biogenesis protein FliO
MKYLRYPLLLAFTLPAFAQQYVTPSIAEPPSIIASAVRMIGALFIVISVILTGAWAFKNKEKFAGKLVGSRVRHAKLQVLETKSLGGRNSICVVAYDNQRLLISTSPTGVTMLTKLPEATLEELHTDVQSPVPVAATPTFTDAFAQALSSRRK